MLGPLKSHEIEEKWMKKWAEENIYAFKEDGRPVYSIDSPPPFTSGDLHMGHVLSYAYFDFVARYKRMNGFDVYYPQGWDCQGFPTEVKVEKKYGRHIPRQQFLHYCHAWTNEFIQRMRAQMQRMGFSPDWKYEYKTMSDDYRKRVQYSLLSMYDRGILYMKEHPVHWCPRCASAIAKAEIDDIQRNTTLYYLRFFLQKEGKEEEVLVATTRPELLHACVAVFYHPSDDRYAALQNAKIKTPLGSVVPFLADSDVEKEFGTGVVMLCTYGDKQDVVWQYRHHLPMIKAIDEHGRLTNAGEYTGLSLSEAKKKIIADLAAKGLVAKEEPLAQVVKVHDRCGTPVEFVLSREWFANLKDYREAIINAARAMRWVPDYTIVYLEDWVKNLEWDWVISRDRIFGTPIPFWFCDSCKRTVPANVEELPVDPAIVEKNCPVCSKPMRGETKVCDCWIDSSLTPLIITQWPWDNELGEGAKPIWKARFPVSLRPQGTEIIRTWAFYTIYRSLVFTGKAPFRELLLNGNVLAPDGKKMSKSLGNVIAPDDLIQKYSADAIRQWSALSGALAKDRPFIYKDIQFAQSFLVKLWNASNFVLINLRDWDGTEPSHDSLRAVDRWILSRLSEVRDVVTQAFEDFNFHTALNTVHEFFWKEVCDFYLEMVKYRLYQLPPSDASRRAAQWTLSTVFITTLKLLAPIVPFHTEELYQHLSRQKGSIHLSPWPSKLPRYERDQKNAAFVLDVLSAIRKYKTEHHLSMKDIIDEVVVSIPDVSVLVGYEDEIRSTGGVRTLTVAQGQSFSVSIRNDTQNTK